jgi:hypothetical protein
MVHIAASAEPTVQDNVPYNEASLLDILNDITSERHSIRLDQCQRPGRHQVLGRQFEDTFGLLQSACLCCLKSMHSLKVYAPLFNSAQNLSRMLISVVHDFELPT